MNIVYVPCKNTGEARKIAYSLIKEKLAVCVNVIPSVLSIYRWKGKIEDEREALCVIKTSERKVKDLFQIIRKLHSYSMPEIISWKIDNVASDVLMWVNDELGTNKTP